MGKRLDRGSGDVVSVEHVAAWHVTYDAGPHEADEHPPNPTERPTTGELVDGGQVQRAVVPAIVLRTAPSRLGITLEIGLLTSMSDPSAAGCGTCRIL